MGRLLPAFRRRVDRMLVQLRADGYDPLVWETFRTQERQDHLRKRGASKARKSMHQLGAAVDVVCGLHLWSCRKEGCDFFAQLGRAAKAQGLHWGGDMFPKNPVTGRRFIDQPHVQAVSYWRQWSLRRAKDKAAYVAQRLGECA